MKRIRAQKGESGKFDWVSFGKGLLGALVLVLLVASAGASATTGVLTQLAGTDGCVSDDGSGGACADGNALSAPWPVAVSRDGKHVYVGSIYSPDVAV